jgi:uncharacterized protein
MCLRFTNFNNVAMSPSSHRLDVVDCLRGFAIVSIMLLHNLEHFNLYFSPVMPAWMAALDKVIWNSMFFVFSGKSYAIFAMLFGLTFFIQFNNRALRGEDFRPRFAWRLVLLLLFGTVNSLFYDGDVLSVYAVLGLALIPVARLSNKAVFAIAVVLMLQPVECINALAALDNPGAKLANPASWAYFDRAASYLKGDSVLAAWFGNITNGKVGALHWWWETGRVCKIMSLFMLGMLAGRQGLFAGTEAALRFWKRILIAAALCFVPLYLVGSDMNDLIPGQALRRPLDIILNTWSDLALMLVLVSLFVLLFRFGAPHRFLRLFAPLGRMSLTSYMTQSLIGSTLYHGFGFALYKVTGPTMCLLIGVTLAILQGSFSTWWLRRHQQGPLEALWHRATWWGHRPANQAIVSAS